MASLPVFVFVPIAHDTLQQANVQFAAYVIHEH